MTARTIAGRPLIAGMAAGELLVAREPLSFWGGFDPTTGEIIDRRHPLSGRNAAGTIFAVPSTRGSSTTTAVLLEAIRRGTAPAALLCERPDAFLALAAIVAEELYGTTVPVVSVGAEGFTALETGRRAEIGPGGEVLVG